MIHPNKNIEIEHDHPTTEQEFMTLEEDYHCTTMPGLDVVIARGKGVELWDVNDKRYLDFLSAFCCTNQGNCHPKIIEAMTQQANALTITTMKVHNNVTGVYSKLLCDTLGYDKCLLMNSGAEAVEEAIKIARKWGYEKKKIPKDEAVVLFADNCYHGLLLATTGAQTKKEKKKGTGPYDDLGFDHIAYDDTIALENKLKSNSNIAAFIVEPLQGQGIIPPSEGYLKKVADICKKYNVIFICDEIQMGLGRCGKMLCCNWDNVKPDMVLLGKSLSGGFYPLSAVLADNAIMDLMNPGEIFSTYGANPLAAAVGIAALEVLVNENMIQNSEAMGKYIFEKLSKLKHNCVTNIKGKGLMIGMGLDKKLKEKTSDIEGKLTENGIIASVHKDNKENITLRLSPPLIITKEQIDEAVSIIDKVLKEFD